MWALVLGGIVVLIAAAGWGWKRYFGTYHLAVVDEGKLLRTGNRTMREYINGFKAKPFKTVVTLVDNDEIVKEPFAGETVFCRANGIDLVRIPIILGGWPTTEQVRQFLAIAQDPKRQPVIVHCAQGVRRTGMMVAAYQESVMGYDRERMQAEMLTFGHSSRTVNDIRRFIDIYEPKMQTVTKELERSRE